jgi:replicative DNA helicase
MISDLRESGGIESDADQVHLLYRDEVYHGENSDEPGVAELNVAKNRNGPQKKVKLAFIDRWPQLVDMSPGHRDPGPEDEREGETGSESLLG